MISEKKQQAIIGMVIEALIDPVPGFERDGLIATVKDKALTCRADRANAA